MKKTNLLLCSALVFGAMNLSLVSCGKTEAEENEHFEDDKEETKVINLNTLSEAVSIAEEAGNNKTKDIYVVKGKFIKYINITLGHIVIEDETSTLEIQIKDYESLENKPQILDEITFNGHLIIKNDKATLIEASIENIIPYEPIKDSDGYYETTIAYARTLPVDELVKITGVVAGITNNSHSEPASFFLIDETGSINVYSKDVASVVHLGNTITIKAKRSNYISSRETNSASKWGYEGSIQVKDAVLVSNDEKVSDFNTGWIKKSTMKELINTPVTDPVTTLIYKIKGYVHKNEGQGFTNYHINDLDDVTGSYTYSQNNGLDFAWLEKFDGKLCDIYISPINCKASSSSCYFRFVPIKVKEADKAVDDYDVPQYVLDYYVKDLILETYNANPETILPKQISNTKLGFENVNLTYVSSDENIIKFIDETTNISLNALNDGIAEVQVIAKYQDYEATLSKYIRVSNKKVENAIGVKEAIDTPDNTEVIVKGIVQASMLTRRGFYIADSTGVISVLVADADCLKDIKIGDEVYMKGTKVHFEDSKTDNYPGQITINDAVVELNAYGRHELDKTSYDTSKTISQLCDIPLSDDATAKVFTTKCIVKHEVGNFSVNVSLVDPANQDKSLFIYNSNGGEVEYLEEFKDKEVTVDVALCNWNRKKDYRACVLSISDGTTTKLCNQFLKK